MQRMFFNDWLSYQLSTIFKQGLNNFAEKLNSIGSLALSLKDEFFSIVIMLKILILSAKMIISKQSLLLIGHKSPLD